MNIKIQAVTNISNCYPNVDGSYTTQGTVYVLSPETEVGQDAYFDVYYRGSYDDYIDFQYNIEATFTKNGSDMKLLKYVLLDDVG